MRYLNLFLVQGKRRRRDENSLLSLKIHFVGENSVPKEEDSESFCLTDSGLTAVANGFAKLEKLSLIWCSNVTSFGVVSLAQKCTFLKSLDLQVIHYMLGEVLVIFDSINLLCLSIWLIMTLILSII